MPNEIGYNRIAVVNYASTWAFSRNPKYLDFENLGGDCTNFASQCIYAGCGVMNYTPVYGWYYNSANDRTASWTGVQYLYNFLTKNKGTGPYAQVIDRSQITIGDIIQLGSADGRFYHSPVVVRVTPADIYIAAHTRDAYMRPLSSYVYGKIRYLHIAGARK